jgi:hypothetical protein
VTVFEILSVLVDLNGRMQKIALTPAYPTTNQSFCFGCLATLPLFEFDNYSIWIFIFSIPAEHAVEAL